MFLSKKYARGIFIHRRDLRVQDNTALARAVRECDEVFCCFIIDPVQAGSQNEYRSENQIAFMRESLEDLQAQYEKVGGTLQVLSGEPSAVLANIMRAYAPHAVYVNADYTPYSKSRDESLAHVCNEASHAGQNSPVEFNQSHDLLLCGDPADILTGTGTPFSVFTPFWRKAAALTVPKPHALPEGMFCTKPLKEVPYGDLSVLLKSNDVPERAEHGGRVAARAILAGIGDQRSYADDHNDPTKMTSKLSGHNKFGNVSIREVFYAMEKALGGHSPLLRQLYWRDFYTYIVFHFPHVVGKSYDAKNEILYWNQSEADLKAWQEGRTGFPIVDAGMRELNATGYMHNRLRLITGSFLTKDLHMPWWLGEKYFAQKLVDYDLSLNNGNWQWVGGTGVDPVPYFRIFNSWLQAKKFDPRAEYIKMWVPELAGCSASEIHDVGKTGKSPVKGYPDPMIDHQEELQKVKALYKKEV